MLAGTTAVFHTDQWWSPLHETFRTYDYRLCGLVIRAPGYRFRGPGSIPGASRFFREVVGLELGPLSLLSTIEELLGRKSGGSKDTVVGIRYGNHVAPNIRKSWH
jgi:hypothetical protein